MMIEKTSPGKPARKTDPYDTQKVRILAVTWNLHGKIPKNDEDLETLLNKKRIIHDIYVIGT